VLAAAEGAGLVVTNAYMEMALAELDEGGRLAQRLLGFRPETELGDAGAAARRTAERQPVSREA